MWILTDCEEIGMFINAILSVRGHFNTDDDIPVDEVLSDHELACLSACLMGLDTRLICFQDDLAQLREMGFAVNPLALFHSLTYQFALTAQNYGGILTDVHIQSNEGFIGLRVDHGSFEFCW